MSFAQILNLVAGAFGIAGGILWFFAAGQSPPPAQGSYWDVQDSPDSPFASAWTRAANLNKWAALATGISALLFGLSAFVA